MKTKITAVCLLLSLNFVTYAKNAKIHIETTGDKSPAINSNGGAVTINYSSKEEIDKIVAIYAQQHKLDTEQIKSLTAAVTALSQGKDVIGTESQIQAAMAALAQGNTAQAKALFEKETQRVELAAKQGAEAYRNLGALAFLDNTQEALHAYRRATELDTDNAEGWNRLGTLLYRVGEWNQAITAFEKELELGQRLQNQHVIAFTYSNLGTVYKTRGELDKAIAMHNKALAINEILGFKESIANNYNNLGIVYSDLGELDKAIAFYNRALNINESLGIKEGMALNYTNLGNIYGASDKHNKAIEMYQKSLEIIERLDDKEMIAVVYGNLGNVYYLRGDLDKAIEMYDKALAIDKALDRKEGIALKYSNLGSAYKQKGNKAEAKRYYQKSIELYKYIGSPMAKKIQSWLDAL